jgi:amino acid adenylation domain-containing protein/thioester reductase-like protein
MCSNLRTRIIDVSGTAVQVVIANDFSWEQVNTDVRSFISTSSDLEMGYGTRLSRCALVEEGGDTYFVQVCHHSVFDGYSMGLILSTLRNLYQGLIPEPLAPYAGFIQHVMDLDQAAAATYWKESLDGALPSSFPGDMAASSLAATNGEKITRRVVKMIPWPKTATEGSITKATVTRAAWALILARYGETNDICFGATVSGRSAQVAGLERMSGPAIATVPVRLVLDSTKTTLDFLRDVQSQAFDMAQYEQFGLYNISKLTQDIKQACNFSSLFIAQPAYGASSTGSSDTDMLSLAHEMLDDALEGYFNYPLVTECVLYDDAVELSLVYNSKALADKRIEALGNHFEHLVQQMLTDSSQTIGQLSAVGSWDMQQIVRWNDRPLEPVNECLHELVSQQARLSPGNEAIYTTAGSLTYAELDNLSDKLASHLIGLGVKHETPVVICFEKSYWAVVAMLGVMKAGGVFIPLDPSHPASRRHAIIEQVAAEHVMVSPHTHSDFDGVVPHVVELSQSTMASTLSQANASSIKKVKSSGAAYIIFSSGSTGKPKGIVVEHAAISASIVQQGHVLDVPGDTIRCLQFGSFAFDGNLYEIFIALSRGGTACIPSDEERLEHVSDFIRKSNTNVALLSPSFVRTIRPDQVPSLKILMLMGEAPDKANINTWLGHVKLVNGFGPTEACVMCSSNVWNTSNVSPTTIGRSIAHISWIVEPDNYNKLAPIGCVGELLVQGHAIARGYLGDEAQTKDKFIDTTMPWMPSSMSHLPSRFYRTGDLVSYNADGSLEYHGRRDTQVKIRGQRIELGEVENQIKKVSDCIAHAAAGLMHHGNREILVAHVSLTEESDIGKGVEDSDGEYLTMDGKLQEYMHSLVKDLRNALPGYMVPAIVFPRKSMPLMGASMKLDRSALRKCAEGLGQEDLESFSLLGVDRRAPETETEKQLQEIWSDILDMPKESIGTDDGFYHIGGDSISIIKVAKQIEEKYHMKFSSRALSDGYFTISAMARLVDGTDKLTRSMDLAGEIAALTAHLDRPLVKLLENPSVPCAQNMTVLVTGASGYLGNEILKQLLNNKDVGFVIAHVRASSEEHGLKRIREAAEISGWWSLDYADKLEIWIGDLQQEHIGLNNSQWSRVCGIAPECNVDAIIHNGASVNWNLGYNSLRQMNVASTMDLLEASMTSPVNPKFVFVSGGISLVGITDLEAMVEASYETNGYIQTKLVADVIFKNLFTKLPKAQNRVSVVKPGRLIGNKDKGVANTDDYLWRVVAGAVSMGIYPTRDTDQWMPVADVSMASNVISNKLFAVSHDNTAFEDITVGVSTLKFWELVNAQLDTPCTPVSWDEWISEATDQLETVGDNHPLWAIQDFLSSLGTIHPGEGTNAEGDEVSEHLNNAISANVSYLQSIGYLQPTMEDYKPIDSKVVKRSATFQV